MSRTRSMSHWAIAGAIVGDTLRRVTLILVIAVIAAWASQQRAQPAQAAGGQEKPAATIGTDATRTEKDGLGAQATRSRDVHAQFLLDWYRGIAGTPHRHEKLR